MRFLPLPEKYILPKIAFPGLFKSNFSQADPHNGELRSKRFIPEYFVLRLARSALATRRGRYNATYRRSHETVRYVTERDRYILSGPLDENGSVRVTSCERVLAGRGL